MIIGSEFSNKYQQFLKEVVSLSKKEMSQKIAVQKVNDNLKWDRTEIKHVLEYMQELGLIKIETIGGPLLYGHITVTKSGFKKYQSLIDQE
ncbi:hypothetical protein [Fodinibius sp. SL11]|uniref:hypothetical protein n=1 Tax=Fodinibius sp. SL11 TaxID=3425690 RepID=UPI003F88522D